MKSKKGFRKIDNEYYLAILAADLTRAGTKVLLAVIHFTLGYNQRDTADISLSTFQNLTQLSRPAVKTAIRELIVYGLITRIRQGSTDQQAAIYNLNTNIETWTGKAGLPPRGKVDLPSEMSKTYPVDAENLPSTGQVPTPAPVPLKKERKPSKEIPVGTAKKQSAPQPLVTLIFNEMKAHLGFPGKIAQDPIPSYGKEGQAIKRMLARGFSLDEILACWKGKVAERGGDFVSMVWVNEDIGKKAGRGVHQQSSRRLPKVYRPPEEIFREQDSEG